jgi:hypothetical protein
MKEVNLLIHSRQRMRPLRFLAVLVLLLATVPVVRPAPAAADAAGLGGDYVALPAGAALLDTRNGTGGKTGLVGQATAVSFPVLGVGGIPTTGVSAVLVRLVTTSGTGNTWLRAYPDGTTPTGGYSNLDAAVGDIISNTDVVRPGTNGKIAVYNSTGSTHIIVTAFGYYRTATGAGGGFVPVSENLIVDTRNGVGTTKAKIASNATRTITLTGAVIPAGAKAVMANVIVLNQTANGWLGVTPAGGAAATQSSLNFMTGGAHAHTVSLPLSTAGQVVFSNHSGGTIDLIVAPYGYVTASSSEGAGYRYVTPIRVYDSSTSLAANATVDVQVTGKLGMPTRNVAGVMVSVIAASPTVGGGIKVWPTGGAEPNVGQVYFRTGKTTAGLAIVKPGTDGKIRLKNSTSGTVRFVVDFEGYLADPIPQAPVESYTPTIGLQSSPVAGASLGMVEYAYTDNIGRVLIGHQTDVDNYGSVQWTVMSGNEAFGGQPSLAAQSDGKIQLDVRYSDSDIWSRTQSAVGSATWAAWADFGGSMAAAPTVTKLPSGVMAAFAVDADGKLWVYEQSGSIPFWKPLSDQDFTGTPVVAATRTGVRLFIRTVSGTVKTAEYVDSSLSAWVDLGGSSTTAPAVVVYPGFRIRLFAQQADGTMATMYQDASGVFPADWTPVGTAVLTGAPAAILDPVIGRTAVVARDRSGTVLVSWETTQGSGVFGDWSQAIPDVFEAAYTDPAIVPLTNSTGQTWVILFRNVDSVTRIYQRGTVSGLGLTAVPQASFTAHALPAPPAN